LKLDTVVVFVDRQSKSVDFRFKRSRVRGTKSANLGILPNPRAFVIANIYPPDDVVRRRGLASPQCNSRTERPRKTKIGTEVDWWSPAAR